MIWIYTVFKGRAYLGSVGLGLNCTEGGIHLLTTVLHCIEPLVIVPTLSQYDLINVERCKIIKGNRYCAKQNCSR